MERIIWISHRLNHLHEQGIRRLATLGLVPQLSSYKFNCPTCNVCKPVKGSPPKISSTITTRPGELTHTDLAGPLTTSKSGYNYVITFTDDFSRYTTTRFLRHKSDAFLAFEQYDNFLYNTFCRHTSILRSDNGGEYINSSFDDYCKAFGIVHQRTVPENPHQNGVSERFNRTLWTYATAITHDCPELTDHWDEVLANVTYTKNRVPHSSINHQIPYEKFFGHTPSLSHLQACGSPCYAITSAYERRKSSSIFKFADHAKPCLFLGYSETSKAYKLLDLSGVVILSKYEDTTFKPHTSSETAVSLSPLSSSVPLVSSASPISSSSLSSSVPSVPSVSSASLPSSVPLVSSVSPISTSSSSSSVSSVSSVSSPSSPSSATSSTVSLLRSPPSPLHDYELRKRPRLDYSAMSAKTVPTSTEEILAYTNVSWFALPHASALTAERQPLPTTYAAIEQLADSDDWYRATDAEIASLIDHGTWKLVPLPSDRKALNNKWVFRIKTDSEGKITRYKARLCACGYNQLPDVDFKEVFSPVVRNQSLLTFLTLVASLDLECVQADVTSAFLYGKLDEEVYMRQPPGYVDPSCPNHVCKLVKSLYGLKQAPRVWHKTITPFLESLGFTPLITDPCLFQRKSDSALIALYVDDLAIAAPKLDTVNHIISELQSTFKITSDGDLSFLLGIKIRRDRSSNSIFLSSSAKILKMLADFRMDSAESISTPMHASSDVMHVKGPLPNSEEWTSMQSVPYRECVGSLIHLMRTCRPDLAFCVSATSRFLHNPGRTHWNAVKRVLRYLKDTLDYELTLGGSTDLTLSGYSDASWGGTGSVKSTTGYAFFLGSSLISWASRSQSTVASSVTVAEANAVYAATLEALALRNLLFELDHLSLASPTKLFCDNEIAIKISKDSTSANATRHLLLRLAFLREQVTSGNIDLLHCRGSTNIADGLTKALGPNNFLSHRESIGIVPCVLE